MRTRVEACDPAPQKRPVLQDLSRGTRRGSVYEPDPHVRVVQGEPVRLPDRTRSSRGRAASQPARLDAVELSGDVGRGHSPHYPLIIGRLHHCRRWRSKIFHGCRKHTVGYQIARDSEERLTQAEADLTRALELNTRIGDARGCFQQCRNLGLIHTKLADLQKDKAHSWLGKALADYEAAEKFLSQLSASPKLPAGSPVGELMETYFRRGEVLVRRGSRDEAEDALLKVLSHRQTTKD